MKATLIAGSPKQHSHTRALMNHLASQLDEREITVSVWDIAEHPLPPFEVEFHYDQSLITNHEALCFLEELNSSDMIVIGTPLYHGSYSGALKNAIDYLLKDQLLDKPVGLVANGGGNTKNMIAISHLVGVVQTLYGVPMQTQIGTSGGDYSEQDSGFELQNPEIKARCIRLVDELIRYAKLLKH